MEASLETIEYLLFGIIVLIQIIFFLRTRNKIREFDLSIADISTISISEQELSEEQIDGFSSTADIFAELGKETAGDGGESGNVDNDTGGAVEGINLTKGAKDETKALSGPIRIRLVESTANNSEVFGNILNSLNKYLLRNRHSVADFSLIKDIVERNTDTIEEEVNLTLSTPLYLGLMGTMLGIVIGIFSMSSLIGADIRESSVSVGIATLLGSVKIAMIASFVGLMLTIFNSAITFKGSKFRLENKKNDFYTKIQVELLPTLNQGMNATFESLQRNLFRFNEKFDANLDRLGNVFDKNYDSVLMQKQLVEQMDKSKVAEISGFNIKVLGAMGNALAQFDKFDTLFSNINTYLANSFELTQTSRDLLSRTSNFETIATSVKQYLQDGNRLTEFLATHFSDLEAHKAKVDEAIVSAGFHINDSFGQLKQSLQRSSELLGEEAVQRNLDARKLLGDFSEDLRSFFAQQSERVAEVIDQKKSSLDELRHLQSLLAEVKALKGGTQISEQLSGRIEQLSAGILTTNGTLERIERETKKSLFSKIFTSGNS
ncbi:hypothetical protein ACTJKC_02350 [Pedobacter sp. 22226]|uniref:hypothetical protein n=1 Tax=Pedobacter sp. 22226 TaxID=3453894 RepID=UPI003F83855B